MERSRRGDAKTIIIVVLVVLVVMALACGGVLVALLLPAVQSARTAARAMQSSNNLKQIALALHNYHDTHGTFPPAYLADENGQPMHSWRVLILPYVEAQHVYRQYDFDQPWDSPANLQVAEMMPAVYASPFLDAAEHPTRTPYVAVVGPNTAINSERGVAFREVLNGLSNVVLATEDYQRPVVWTQPIDLSPQQFLQQNFDNTPSRATNVMFGDGSVLRVDQSRKAEAAGWISIDGS